MKYLVPFIGFFCATIHAQVGSEIQAPQAKLVVTEEPSGLVGELTPRLTGNQLSTITYTDKQTAAIVYVTAADTSPSGQTIDVTEIGSYYFNGSIWILMGSKSKDWIMKGNSKIIAGTPFIETVN